MGNQPTAILDEPLMSLAQIATIFPQQRNDRPVHPETVKDWITKGVQLHDGSRVFLAAVRVGSRWLSGRRSVAEFIAAQTAAANRPASQKSSPGSARRDQATRTVSEAASPIFG